MARARSSSPMRIIVLAMFLFVLVYVLTSRPDATRARNAFAIDAKRYEVEPGHASSPVIKDSKENWELRRRIALAQVARQVRTYETWGRLFFQNNWEPQVSCAYERRMGNAGDGGKWICDPDTIESKEILVYSIGSNNDYSFEIAAYEFFGNRRVEIHTFDFGTPYDKPEFVQYHQIMLGGKDSSDTKSLKTLINELGHSGRTIDILKIDIEGYEHDVLMSAVKSGVFEHVNQLQVEVHLIPSWIGHFAQMNPSRVHELFVALNSAGMEIFHKEANTLAEGDACEFSFVKVKWSNVEA